MFSTLLVASWRCLDSFQLTRGAFVKPACGSVIYFFMLACHQPVEPTEAGSNAEPVSQRTKDGFKSILVLLTPQAIPQLQGASHSTTVVSTTASFQRALGVAGMVSGPTLFGIQPSSAHGINAHGQLVFNESQIFGPDPGSAYRREADGRVTQLRAVTESGTAVALDLNDDGVAAGSDSESDEVSGQVRSFATVWSTDGTPSRLPVAPGGAFQGAAGINANRVAVGVSASPRRAIRWDAQGAHALPMGSADSSAAFDLNNAGTAVGWISEGSNLVPVTWSAARILSRLALPAGAVGGTAAGINRSGQVVGQAVYKDASGAVVRSEAVLWSVTGVPRVLPGLGFGMAVKINEAGVVAGWTSETRSGGDAGPVIWAGNERIPVPLGDGEGSTSPGWALVHDLNARHLSGVANPDGQDNHQGAALWSFTVTGACAAPAISTQPQGATVLVGRQITLSVATTGTPRLAYQWRKNGTAIPGATSATYRVARAKLAHAGNYTVVVTNRCGSMRSSVARVAVHFDFRGFLRPTANPGPAAPYVVNRTPAGSAVPIKFSLTGNQGHKILASGNPRSKRVACTLANTSGGQPTRSVGGGIAYNRGADQYRYVWKTEKSWTGTCRQLMVGLVDGTVHSALFKFIK